MTGRRTDRVTYVFDRPGNYRLPEVEQPWWDLKTGTAHKLTQPGLMIIVKGSGHTNVVWILAPVLIALAALAGWFRRRPPPPEAAAFRELRRACRGADAKITYRAWQAWNTQRSGRSIPPELASAIATLERSLFSSSGSWRPEIHTACWTQSARPATCVVITQLRVRFLR